jgi:hypothetical protein
MEAPELRRVPPPDQERDLKEQHARVAGLEKREALNAQLAACLGAKFSLAKTQAGHDQLGAQRAADEVRSSDLALPAPACRWLSTTRFTGHAAVRHPVCAHQPTTIPKTTPHTLYHRRGSVFSAARQHSWTLTWPKAGLTFTAGGSAPPCSRCGSPARTKMWSATAVWETCCGGSTRWRWLQAAACRARQRHWHAMCCS